MIDLGSACYSHQKVYTYIQSRFYRAPEVIVSMGYTAAIDMWSLGCMCFELSLGTPLFDGQDEHDQIIRQVDLLGIPPVHMIEKSKKGTKFFELVTKVHASSSSWRPSYHGDGHVSIWQLRDPQWSSTSVAASSTYNRLVIQPRSMASAQAHAEWVSPREKLKKRLAPKYQDTPLWNAFIDMLLSMLEWDPKLRIKPGMALQCEFLAQLKKQADGQQAAAAAAAAAATAGVCTVGDGLPCTSNATTSIWAPEIPSATAAAGMPQSSVFSHAAVKAFVHQLAPQVAEGTSNSTASATVTSSADTAMSDVSTNMAAHLQPHQPTKAPGLPPAALTAYMTMAQNHTVAPATTAAATSSEMDTSEDVPESKSAKPPPSKLVLVQTTPTRKRHSASSPRSPGSVQGTPKTRALAASARQLFDASHSSPRLTRAQSLQMQQSPSANAPPSQHPDVEIEHMQLPQQVYQSPSTRPIRSMRRSTTKDSAISAQPGLARSVPSVSFMFDQQATPGGATIAAVGLPPRRMSENSQDPLSPAYNVMTRSKGSQLQTPPFGPLTPTINGMSASNLGRQLQSDPLALHLGSPAIQPQTGSLAAIPDMPANAMQVFPSPQTLKRQRRGITTRSRQVGIDLSDDENSNEHPTSTAAGVSAPRSTRRGRSLAAEQWRGNMDISDEDAHRVEKENRSEVHNSQHITARRGSTSKTPALVNGTPIAPTTPSRTKTQR